MNNSQLNRQWLLRERPKGELDPKIFDYKEGPRPVPAQNQVLVRVEWFSFDPTQRMWMGPIPTYMPPVELGQPMRSVGLGTVVESKHTDYPVGMRVQGVFAWADYIIAEPGQLSAPSPADANADPTAVLHLLGTTGMTAWAGIRQLGKVKAGEVVLVSAAAGATGSVAAQLAKCIGAKVIGIAGSKEKCDWLTQTCGLDAAINYRSDNLDESLKEHCPKGIDVFFDNVGGSTLDIAFKHAAPKGRIVLCGQIAHYQTPAPPMQYFMHIILKSLTVQGFLVFDYIPFFAEARAELLKHEQSGKIHTRHDVQEGFKQIPQTLLRIFSGQNNGKQLLKNDIA